MISDWPIESIPDEDRLSGRVPKSRVIDGWPDLGMFSNGNPPGGGRPGLSTDWNKYATPEETRARSPRKAPDDYAVIFFIAGMVRTLPLQTVEHTPWCNEPEIPELPDNRAHSDIFGPKTAKDLKTFQSESASDDRLLSLEIRAELQNISDWAIRP